jgi:protein-disulfide isomerase
MRRLGRPLAQPIWAPLKYGGRNARWVTFWAYIAHNVHHPGMDPLDERIDHIRGADGARTILEYGDYECPYSRRAYRQIQEVERRLDGNVRFAFRHFPLTDIHPHAQASSAAAEAAALQGRFWEMHDLLFHRQKALEDEDLRGYARDLGLDLERFDADRGSEAVAARIARDVTSGRAAGVDGTPRLFIDGVLHQDGYDADLLAEILAS